jgi:hypothetical protein
MIPRHETTRVALPRDERHCSKENAKSKTLPQTPRFIDATKRGFPAAARGETAV